jgi:hypothetical protein
MIDFWTPGAHFMGAGWSGAGASDARPPGRLWPARPPCWVGLGHPGPLRKGGLPSVAFEGP